MCAANHYAYVLAGSEDRSISFHRIDAIHQAELLREQIMQIRDALVDTRPMQGVFRPAVDRARAGNSARRPLIQLEEEPLLSQSVISTATGGRI